MIVRHLHSDLLLITQADHAVLAAQIADAWTHDGFPQRPTRARVIEATRLHDIGWRMVDASPGIDPAQGIPYDVIHAPLAIRQEVWPRAVVELASHDFYIAALVAQHALTVYQRFDDDPEWKDFFVEMAHRRDELLAANHLSAGDAFLDDYAILGWGDRWSLVFCFGWQERAVMGRYQAILRAGTPPNETDNSAVVDGGRLEITPDPFAGATVPLDVPARRIPLRRYTSEDELQATISSAPVIRLTGTACGTPPR